MKTDKQIIEAMNLQDEKNSIRADMLRDELHERRMRTDLNYFFKHSEFIELNNLYEELSQKALEYGWVDVKVKDYL